MKLRYLKSSYVAFLHKDSSFGASLSTIAHGNQAIPLKFKSFVPLCRYKVNYPIKYAVSDWFADSKELRFEWIEIWFNRRKYIALSHISTSEFRS